MDGRHRPSAPWDTASAWRARAHPPSARLISGCPAGATGAQKPSRRRVLPERGPLVCVSPRPGILNEEAPRWTTLADRLQELWAG